MPLQGNDERLLVVRRRNRAHEDIAWTYDFPTIHANRIAGLTAFYNEHVDLYVDGFLLPKPVDPTQVAAD